MDVKDYVRLYFRPKTPTQYHNEGFSLYKERKFPSAHVPVPVFLAFRSYEILNQPNTSFSNCSLASHDYQLMQGIEEFSHLDFPAIYHDKSINEEDISYIMQRKQAEVVVKDQLDLKYLDIIWCRSNAEYVTLINLLEDHGILNIYKDKIGIKQASDLFYMRFTYVDKVHLKENQVSMEFNNVESSRPIEMQVEIEIGTHKLVTKKITLVYPFYTWDLDDYTQMISAYHKYRIKIYFADPCLEKETLVYYGKWSKELDFPY